MTSPPLYFTRPSDEDIAAGDGANVINFIETYCSLTNKSFGGNAGDLMIMRPWQRSLLMCMYARNHVTYDDERPIGAYCYKRLLVGLPRKNGKLLDVDTPILTANGWRTMGTLCEGDYVHATDGSLTRVEWVSEIETKQAYRVCFKDGAQIVAGPEHEWLVNDRMRNKSRVATTQELHETLHSGSARGDRRYTVDVPASLDRPEADLLIDPYILGAWLGDGSKASGQVTGMDEEIFGAFVKAGYTEGKRQKKPHNRASSITFLGLGADLRNIGVLENKHFPENYLLASRTQRLELLRGLMDTDGCVNITGNYASAQCEFTNTNKVLAQGVLFLARSLGWKASMREGQATLYGKDCGPKYRVFWTADRQMPPFRLWRKTKRLKESQGARSRTNAIVSIEPIGERQLCCIEVAHPSHCYLADHSLTPTHNSSLAAPLALYQLFTSIDNNINGSRVVVCASSKNQASGIVFNTAKEIVRMNDALNSLITPFRTIELRSADFDCSMRAVSAVAENQEGLNPDFIVYDELHTAPNPELYHTMAMSQGARPDAMMLAITTAGAKYDQTNSESICYQQYQYGQKVCSGELDDPSFFMAWWGVPENSDYADEAVWEAANPGWNDLNTPSLFRTDFKQLHASQFKALDVSTPILTSNRGWIAMGTVRAGDTVYAGDGSPTTVVGTSDVFTGRKCFEVTFDDGRTIVADDEHDWHVLKGCSRKRDVVTTGKLDRNCRIELPGPLQMPVADLLVDPYILGLWLGDGSKAEPTIAAHASDVPHVLAQVERAGYHARTRHHSTAECIYISCSPVRPGGRSRITQAELESIFNLRSKGWTVRAIAQETGISYGTTQRVLQGETRVAPPSLRGQLIQIGVLNNKHIPDQYLTGSAEQRLSLLQGLLDSDGSIAAGRVTFTNTNKNLIDGVIFLAQSLGFKPRVRDVKTGHAKAWMVSWTMPKTDLQPFRMQRKQSLVKYSDHARATLSRVVSVEEVASRPTRCLAVQHFSHTFLAGSGLMKTGNTKHLNMWVNQFASWLPEGSWAACADLAPFVDDGEGIVLGFDGSINNDTTALIAMTISENPVVRVIGLWEKPPNATAEWEVPREEVKEAIRDTCRRYDVKEVACDEYLWISELQELAAETLPIVRFPKSPSFMIPATQGLYEDVINKRIRHNGDPRLQRHFDNCVLKMSQRGPYVTKETKASSRKIDLSICVMAANARVKYFLENASVDDSNTVGVW